MDAFQRQLVELLPRLRRFARSLTRNAADADDLVQTTVERAMAKRNQWIAGSRLDWWTMRILKNAWLDEARSARARYNAPLGEREGDTVDPRAADPGLRDDAIALSQAMATLPEDQRLALALVLVEGLSYAEAASLLEIPPGTLTSRLVRGRMALMTAMEGQG